MTLRVQKRTLLCDHKENYAFSTQHDLVKMLWVDRLIATSLMSFTLKQLALCCMFVLPQIEVLKLPC